MKTSVNKLYREIVFAGLFIIFASIILITGQTKLLVILPCILFAYGILYCFDSFYDNIFFLCFLLCFFTFLLGGQVINRIVPVYGFTFSDEIEKHTDVLLLISLFGLLIGYILMDKLGNKRKCNQEIFDYNNRDFFNIRYISKILFYATYIFWIITLLDSILYVFQEGYTNYYLYYLSRIPAIIRQLAYICPMALFIFLSTMPRKKEAIKPILMYAAYLVLSLGTGRRIYFMTGILIIFAYALLRNAVNPEDKPWVPRKGIIGIIVAIPVLLVFMYLFEYIRSEGSVGKASDYSPLVGFFVRQGTSINVIKYTEYFKDRLNSEAHYSLYNLIKWLQGRGGFFNKLFGLNFDFEIGKQSVLTATMGTNLADFVSYNANRTSFLSGMGYGSCYIAELYVDYGYVGVFIGNIIYGVLLCALLKKSPRDHRIWWTALGFFIIDLLFKAPRATFDAFLGQSLYIECWGTILAVYIANLIVKKQNGFLQDLINNGVLSWYFKKRNQEVKNDMEQKKLIVLGGTSASLDVVENAKKMGIYTIVTDEQATGVSKEIANETARVSTIDMEGLSRLINDTGADGVFCGPSEFNIRNVIRICEKTGLPCYTDMDTWDKCANKDVFKQYCRDYGVDCAPEYAITESVTDEELDQIEYPVIIKPVDRCSSIGITVCTGKDEVREAFGKAMDASNCKRVICEKYIENGGEIFGVRYFLKDGEAYPYLMIDTYIADPYSRKSLISEVTLTPSKYSGYYMEHMDQAVRKMLKGMGLKNGTVFIQALPYNGKIYFHEMGYRLSGGMIFKLTEPLMGINDMQMMIRFAVGGDMITEEEINKIDLSCGGRFGGQLMLPLKAGKVSAIKGLEKVKTIKAVSDFIQYYKENDVIEDSYIGTLQQLFGRFTFVADSQEEILDAIDVIQEELEVFDENGNKMNILPFNRERTFI